MSDTEQHKYCTNQFIELANKLKGDKIDTSLISGALMTASSVYATYVAAGNDGALNPSGVDKVVDMYRRTLEHHQNLKRSALKAGKQAGAAAKTDIR